MHHVRYQGHNRQDKSDRISYIVGSGVLYYSFCLILDWNIYSMLESVSPVSACLISGTAHTLSESRYSLKSGLAWEHTCLHISCFCLTFSIRKDILNFEHDRFFEPIFSTDPLVTGFSSLVDYELHTRRYPSSLQETYHGFQTWHVSRSENNWMGVLIPTIYRHDSN